MKRETTTKELAESLGYTSYWIRHLAHTGKIPGTKRGLRWLFNEKEVRETIFVNNCYTESEET